MTEPEPIRTTPWSDSIPEAAPAEARPEARVARYELREEIARGGMGVVVRAFDWNLNRELAVKLVHSHLLDRPAVLRRFHDEAEILGRLQHPGIVPVHEVGTLPDGRPFFAMKLVAGRTLADLLRGHPPKDAQLGRFLPVFEQVCQTVAFAHSRGFIHRDLKPSNVMVGEFGEVQVMDWGLAKPAGRVDGAEGNTRSGTSDTGTDPNVTAEHHEPSTGQERTTAGQVVGTPAYMPPEQARGELVDERADVFALGGILSEIITGRPPFLGKWDEVLEASRAGRLDPTWDRVRASGADPALIELAVRCLAADPAERPRDAAELAARVAAYRAGVEERLRAAERERAAAEAKAAEQRRKRRWQLAAAAAAGLLVAGGGAFAWWQEKETTDRQRSESGLRENAARLAGERDAEQRLKQEQARRGIADARSLSADLRGLYKFREADAALVQAAELARSGAPDLLPAVEQARDDLAFVVRLDGIRVRKWVWLQGPGGQGRFNLRLAAGEYHRAFSDRGLDPMVLDPAAVAARIAASPIKAELAAALDDWAAFGPAAGRDRLLEVARRADPDPWRDRLRDPATWTNQPALQQLATDADPVTTPPTALSVLVALMTHAKLDPTPLLAAARASHPNDFELAFTLGWWHMTRGGDRLEIGPYEAARALRPDNYAVWNNLANALAQNGDKAGAVAAYTQAIALDRDSFNAHTGLGNVLGEMGDLVGAMAAHDRALALDPTNAVVHANLGVILVKKGDLAGAITAYREAIRLDPGFATAHTSLGAVLHNMGDITGAITSHRRAIELLPMLPDPHYNLGNALSARRDWDGAIAAYREAIRLAPRLAVAHVSLGAALGEKGEVAGALASLSRGVVLNPENALAQTNLGRALLDSGDMVGAEAAHREAIRLDPNFALAHYNLGKLLVRKNDAKGAIAAFRETVRLDPKFPKAHASLGFMLHGQGNVEEAEAAFQEAVRIDPKDAAAHTNLGAMHLRRKQYPEVIACARAAIAANPKYPNAHALLGQALQQTGDLPGVRVALAEAARLDPKRFGVLLAKLPSLPVAPMPRVKR